MRKAVIEVGDYIVREMPTGGWCIEQDKQRISIHDTKEAALTAVKTLLR